MRCQLFGRRRFLFTKKSARIIAGMLIIANLTVLTVVLRPGSGSWIRQLEFRNTAGSGSPGMLYYNQEDKFQPNFQHLSYFPKTKRRELPLSGHQNAYTINDESVCSKTSNLKFIVVVHSASENFLQRETIRRTWGNVNNYLDGEVRVVFMLGMSSSDTTNQNILNESKHHKDIVQGSFLDTYHNLTHKAVLGMRWVSENCLNAKMVIRVDDDVFVNMFQLLRDIDTVYSRSERGLYCTKRPEGTSLIQRTQGKWMLPGDYFKNMTYYPFDYCNGWFVMITPDIIKSLYQTSTITPFLWIEDVYLFGLVREIVGGIQINDMQFLEMNETSGLECFKSQNTLCELRAVLVQETAALDIIWNYSLINGNIHHKG